MRLNPFTRTRDRYATMFDLAPDSTSRPLTGSVGDDRGVRLGKRAMSWRSAIALCIVIVCGLAGGVANSCLLYTSDAADE